MSDTQTLPTARNPRRGEFWLADIFTAVAVGAFLIIEVVGTHVFQWNGGSLSLLNIRQALELLVMGSLVYFAAFNLGLWIDSRR